MPLLRSRLSVRKRSWAARELNCREDVRVRGKKQAVPQIKFLVVDSPIGPLRIEATSAGLIGVAWTSAPAPTPIELPPAPEPVQTQRFLHQAADWLATYFEKNRALTRLPPLSLSGTRFQEAVWRRLIALPPGTTITYGEIARDIRHAGASRAVGQAVGANPLAILIPCHRVLAAGGKLGGFSSGLWRKRWLLAHEGLAAGRPPAWVGGRELPEKL
jgi:methylated-DNA-[protein]-cysteine S-methyltransferase